MRRSLLPPLVAGALLALIGACGDDDDATLRGAVRTPPLEVADVVVPRAEDGAPHEMRAEDGELLLVYFGYTMCPDVCPTTMSDPSVALEDLPDDLVDRVTVALVTLDPGRDTADVLTGYLAHFFDHSLALRTEDPAALAAAADEFGVQWAVEEHAPGESYDVAHSAITYVVDDTGTVIDELPFGMAADDIAHDLSTLLQEDTR